MLQPIDGLPPLSLPRGPCRTSFSAPLCIKLNDYSNGLTDVTALPLTCPQAGADPSTYSEDCLSMVLYVPTTLTSTSSAPTLVWLFLFQQLFLPFSDFPYQDSRWFFHLWFCNRPRFGRLKTCGCYKLYSSRRSISLGSCELTLSSQLLIAAYMPFLARFHGT